MKISLLLVLSILLTPVYAVDDLDKALRDELGTSSSSKDSNNSEDLTQRFQSQEEAPSAVSLFFKIILVFGLLIGLLYFLLQSLNQKSNQSLPVQSAMKLIGQTRLGTNKSLQMVEIAGRYFVLGASETNLSLVTEITDHDKIMAIQKEVAEFEPPKAAKFVDLLKNWGLHLGAGSASKENWEDGWEGWTSLQKLRKENHEMRNRPPQ
jgi:flagellar biogenesis protein FliO